MKSAITDKMKKGIFFLIAFIYSISGLLYAQDYEIKAVARLDSTKLLMGERMGLNIEVMAASDSAKIDFPLLNELKSRRYVGLLNDSIELSGKYTVDTVYRQKMTEMNFRFFIQAFDSGKYELPPFSLIINGREVATNPVSVEIIPVKVSADDQIDPFSDFASPFEVVPEGLLKKEKTEITWLLWLIAGCVVLLILLGYLFWRYTKTGTIIPKKAPLPPYIMALKQLKKLEKQKLWEKDKTKEYYTRLTDILRRYIKDQFTIKTIERTSAEILDDIDKNEELNQYKPVLKDIFRTADAVKFAKVNPSPEENMELMKTAYRFIENSHPELPTEASHKKGGKA